MRNRYLSLIVLLLMAAFVSVHAQTYDKLWKGLEQFQQKDLPKSIVSEAMRIYDKAKAERNVPQMMKAYLTAMQYRHVITPDSLETDIKGLERWAEQTSKVEDKAVLYAILAEVTMPQNLRQAFGYWQLALKDKEQLLKASTAPFKPIVKLGEASRRYFHDNLYELLARYAIQSLNSKRWNAAANSNQTETLPKEVRTIEAFADYRFVPASEFDFVAAIMQTYQSLLKAYDKKEDRGAYLLTGIDVLRYLNRDFSSSFTNAVCQEQLSVWTKQYADMEVCTEVYVALAQYMESQGNEVNRLQLVREGIAKYPRYAGINQLKNIEKKILNPALTFNIVQPYPGKMQKISVNYVNLTGITLQLYKVNLPLTSALLETRTKDFLSKHASLQKEEHYDLKPTLDYKAVNTTVETQMPMAGIYYLNVVPDGHQSASVGKIIHVTALQIIYRPLPGNKLELVVVDQQTGHPAPDAEIVTYARKGGGYMPLQRYAADKQGTLNLDFLKDNSVLYNAVMPGDNSMAINNLWASRYYANVKTEKREEVTLFTDRSIYRPGQTVYVSGLAYEQKGDSVRVLAGKPYTVALDDVNGNEIGKVEVITNSFGSFSGQFALPSPCLTGFFRLNAGNASQQFRVEEYKRPTFDITFEPVKVQYQAGDSIQVEGLARTFAGAPVQNAKVAYKITRNTSWFWRFNTNVTAQWEGETVTDHEGKFNVPVRFLENADMKVLPIWYYNYEVEATVTNGAGESQETTLTLPLGNRSIILDIDGIKERNLIREKRNQLTLVATNLSGQKVNTEITYEVFHRPASTTQEADTPKSVLKATAISNHPFVPEAIYALPSGAYRLKVSAKDAQGRECTAEQNFILFSLHDKRPPIAGTMDWFYQDGNEFNAQSPVTLYIGSSAEKIYLMYDVFAGDKRLESRRIEFSDSILAFQFRYKEEYGDGILVSLAFVKEGELYAHDVRLYKPQPEKKLQLKWETFRDKLRPGQKEEWRLSMLYPDGRPAQAELLATMYDASLDQFDPHALNFYLNFQRNIPSTYWNILQKPNYYYYLDFPITMLKYAGLQYSELMIPPMNGKTEVMFNSMQARAMGSKRMAAVLEKESDELVLAESEIVEMRRPAALPDKTDRVEVRQNFAETAFFYPQLRTNEKGEVSVSFVLPETLTRWRFLGLAHTQSMDYGSVDTTAVASKEFMLQPNLPRFVRVGDHAYIAASLINLSEKNVTGTVRMELFNPATEKVFYSQKQTFAVAASETGNVNFSFKVSDEYPVIACRLVADGGTFSDGEQNYIPVLTNKQWITESIPLDMNGAGTKTFSLEALFNHHSKTADEQRMTVEFTSDPAWMAVQALPAMSNPTGDDAYSWATAYYANALAASIVQMHPRIKQAFDSWMAQGGTKETWMSQLQKNEELKNIILAETPWVAEATNEADQRRRIATLFDLNTMSNRIAVAIDKLRGLQSEKGAWSWYPGMEGSRYMTTQITELLARLSVLSKASFDSQVAAMYDRAKTYLAEQVAAEYKEMKKAESKGEKNILPSEQALQYLYICALDGNKKADAAVNRYLVGRLAHLANELTIYGKALGAIVLQQGGEVATAREFIQSVMQYSVETPEMGRYFDTLKAEQSWFSYRIPTEVAAIEAIQHITKDETVIEEMKRWLLKEKQTQMWQTPIATVNAVYALLNVGKDMLANTGGVKITVGREVIQTPANDWIGYVKKTVESNVVSIKKITVTKEGAGMGWGAVYGQYLENMDQAGSAGNALSVSRTLLRNGKPMIENEICSVGDKLTVQLTVKADRDMDFIQIKEDRAACLEPVNTLSGYQWTDGLGYYQSMKDASVSFFIDQMPKGTYTIQYEVYVTLTGTYQGGIARIQSAYAPEFGGHSGGYKIVVK